MFYEELSNVYKNLLNISSPTNIFRSNNNPVQPMWISDIFDCLDKYPTTIRRKIMAIHVPSIGKWYQDVAVSRLFEIVAIDDYTATIDIRYEGGEYDDITLDSWSQMALIQANPPEDWRSSMNLSDDERFFVDAVFIPATASDPMSSLELDAQFGWDEL
jgi:hypothetical protein